MTHTTPKVRAMQLVAGLEPERRGVYAGAVGYISFGGIMDTCIAIRTLVVKDRVAYLQVWWNENPCPVLVRFCARPATCCRRMVMRPSAGSFL